MICIIHVVLKVVVRVGCAARFIVKAMLAFFQYNSQMFEILHTRKFVYLSTPTRQRNYRKGIFGDDWYSVVLNSKQFFVR